MADRSNIRLHIPTILKITILFLLFSSCSIFDNEDANVAFVEVTNPIMEVNIVKEGAASHGIKHAWATIDNNLIGVFPIPNKIPAILKNTKTSIQINWGVNDSGDNDSSVEYPFFNPVIIDATLTPNQVLSFPSKVTYVKNAAFDVVEGFESLNHVFTKDLDEDSNTKLLLSTKEKVSGERSALLTITKDNKIIEVTTSNYFNAANNKKGAVWVEFDYKSDEDLFVGYDLITAGAEITEYKIGLRPSKTWKRAYVNLSDEISSSKVQEYRVAFKSAFTGQSGNSIAEIYLDNIKLIHF
jgi:hypothetical protein